MSTHIHNESREINRVRFKDRPEIFNWFKENHIHYIADKEAYQGVIGYNKVTHEIVAGNYDFTYYIIERFDGYKAAFSNSTFGEIARNTERHDNSEGKIVNIQTSVHHKPDGWYDGTDIVIKDVSEISKQYYMPQVRGIIMYIIENNTGYLRDAVEDETADLTIGKAGMSEVELSNIESKLKMLGFPYMLVDLNTIATAKKDSHDVIIYTKQKNVIY
jgi:hypothetical protein